MKGKSLTLKGPIAIVVALPGDQMGFFLEVDVASG